MSQRVKDTYRKTIFANQALVDANTVGSVTTRFVNDTGRDLSLVGLYMNLDIFPNGRNLPDRSLVTLSGTLSRDQVEGNADQWIVNANAAAVSIDNGVQLSFVQTGFQTIVLGNFKDEILRIRQFKGELAGQVPAEGLLILHNTMQEIYQFGAGGRPTYTGRVRAILYLERR